MAEITFTMVQTITTDEAANLLGLPTLEAARVCLTENKVQNFGQTLHDGNPLLYGGEDNGARSECWEAAPVRLHAKANPE